MGFVQLLDFNIIFNRCVPHGAVALDQVGNDRHAARPVAVADRNIIFRVDALKQEAGRRLPDPFHHLLRSKESDIVFHAHAMLAQDSLCIRMDKFHSCVLQNAQGRLVDLLYLVLAHTCISSMSLFYSEPYSGPPFAFLYANGMP